MSSRNTPPRALEGIRADKQTIAVDQAASNDDIVTYVEATLTARLEDKSLVIGNPDLIIEVAEALLKGANGMCVIV